jgi:hypothetical protein
LTGTRLPVYTAFMTPKGHPRQKDEATVKTTIDLPQPLWRKAKVRAIEEGSDLRSVVIRALDAYLKTKLRNGGT